MCGLQPLACGQPGSCTAPAGVCALVVTVIDVRIARCEDRKSGLARRTKSRLVSDVARHMNAYHAGVFYNLRDTAMLKKFLTLCVCAVLATTAVAVEAAQAVAVTSPQAAAALAPGYYFVSVCSSASPVDCPAAGIHVLWFGPYSSFTVCTTAANLFRQGPFGMFPFSISSCFLQ